MRRMAILLVALLLAGVTLQAAVPMMAQGSAWEQTPYAVEAGTVAGGSYQLSSLAWRITGTASGGNYSLSIPHEPSLRGSGCCCTYLPCATRNYQP
jgi:hypothetical protein